VVIYSLKRLHKTNGALPMCI